jgi:putative flippase GtrA
LRQSRTSIDFKGATATIKSVAAYGFVSVLSLLTELALLHTLLAVRLPQAAAVSVAFISASVFQFCTLRYIVFKVTHRPIVIQMNAYVLSAVFSWAAVLGCVTFFTSVFHMQTMLAREITIPLLFPLNYLLNRYFIFRT